ncbi:glycoside hydrolase family 2 protein [Nocardioides cheoyonin]|uniref:glycoside hydrolase family 2 protein n=1 Tax=Nocardioides cheoyonin TaxID=3156615 RepID=UPI0032B59144
MPRNRRLGSAIRSLVAVALAVAATALPFDASAMGREPAANPGVAALSATSRTVDLDASWRFALANPDGVTDPTGEYADAADPAYDDSSWRTVNLPHDWSIELDPTPDHGTDPGTGYLQGGLGWYRKSFTLPPSTAGKQVSVEFDGVYMDSTVYLNGHELGTHPYGYTGFAYDLTPYLHTDGTTPNVLAVQVRNQLPSSRWYSGSGIYRDVRLVVTDPVHVARHGVFVTTPGLASTSAQGYADVHVRTDLATPDGAADVAVSSTVLDARGRAVASGRTAVPDGASSTEADLRLAHPHLWSTDDPYLYRLRTDVLVGGRRVDTTTTTFGARWFSFDPDHGFSLDGRHLKLQGVDLHHTDGALGAAVTTDSLERQLRAMKSMGVNALRTSHNPPSPHLLEVCDRLGIVTMVEAFDTWRTPKVRYDYGRFFDADSDADIAEMVNAAKNSPSVVMWSIGNEIPDSTSAAGVPIARRLIDDVRAIDTTRPIVMGSDKYRSLPSAGSPQDQILRMLDGLGLNYNTAASVDALHAAYPDTFLFESESSSETSTRGAYQDPELLNTGENHTPGKRATSSYDNNLASWTMSGEYGLKKDRDRPWFAGEFLWSGIDYIGEPTPYSVFPVKSSFFGAMDTAVLPKDAYYLFRSQWTSRPMVHLVPMDWTDHQPGDPVQVWAYSNVDSVELTLNGRSLGLRRFDHKTTTDGRGYLETTEATHDDKTVTGGPYPGSYTSPNGSAGKLHLTWTVPFRPGTLSAVARRDGRIVATDVVRTAGAPAAVRLTSDRRSMPGDGRSLAYVTAEVVDAHGTVVPDATNLLHFSVTGGSYAGADNGREEDAENYQSPFRTAYAGKAVAIARAAVGTGRLTVTASSPGLRTGTVTVSRTRSSGPTSPTAPPPPAATAPPIAAVPPVPTGPDGATPDASYSGSEQTVPAAMVDDDAATAWSNAYVKQATALLPAVSSAHAHEWVSLSWPRARTRDTVRASFVDDDADDPPASIAVEYWNGRAWVPARDVSVDSSGDPTVATFARVRTTAVRLVLASADPGSSTGFLRISELSAE